MKRKRKIYIYFIGSMLLIIFFAGLLILDTRKRTNDRVSENEESVQAVTDTKATSSKELKVLVHPWNKPSEDQYPDIKNPENLTIEVSVEKQRVYIKENQKVIYTMVCSTGDSKAGTPTPTGDFLIEPERGEKFYWEEDNDWAYNWVSFSGHGVYLFHSVLMWNDNEVEEKEAIRLGQEASHGCIRLPLPDSKWLYDNIPTGTPVKIR